MDDGPESAGAATPRLFKRPPVAAIRAHCPNPVFLDIQAGDGWLRSAAVTRTPVDPAGDLRHAFDQFAIRAFEVNALDYLIRPFSHERFWTALARAR